MTTKSENLSNLINQLRGAADALEKYTKSEELVETNLFVIKHSGDIARLCNWEDGSPIKLSVIDKENGLVFGDREICDGYNQAITYDEVPKIDEPNGYRSSMGDIRMVVVVDMPKKLTNK